jgi:ATPase subunit of ABC transporter with duplicated ATPase domains
MFEDAGYNTHDVDMYGVSCLEWAYINKTHAKLQQFIPQTMRLAFTEQPKEFNYYAKLVELQDYASQLIRDIPDDARNNQYVVTAIENVESTEGEDIRIGVAGKRGAGKTTLFNCIIGCDLLATSSSGTGTATETEISYWPQEDYCVTVYYKSM